MVGGAGLPYTAANLTTAINAISGFAGTVTVTGAASTGFTVTYGGASAGTDVPSIALVNLSCGGCFASVEETNHGGANDSFTLNYNGNVSVPIVNGTNYTAAGILAALTPILPAGATATVVGFAGGGFNNTGLPGDVWGDARAHQRPGHARAAGLHRGRVRLRRRDRQGRRGRQQGRDDHPDRGTRSRP